MARRAESKPKVFYESAHEWAFSDKSVIRTHLECLGAAIALGLLTPIAGLLLLLDMCAAMWKYNFNEGIYAVREYELPLTLGLACLALAATGAGPFSLDRLLFRRTTAPDQTGSETT